MFTFNLIWNIATGLLIGVLLVRYYNLTKENKRLKTDLAFYKEMSKLQISKNAAEISTGFVTGFMEYLKTFQKQTDKILDSEILDDK